MDFSLESALCLKNWLSNFEFDYCFSDRRLLIPSQRGCQRNPNRRGQFWKWRIVLLSNYRRNLRSSLHSTLRRNDKTPWTPNCPSFQHEPQCRGWWKYLFKTSRNCSWLIDSYYITRLFPYLIWLIKLIFINRSLLSNNMKTFLLLFVTRIFSAPIAYSSVSL